MPRWCPARPSRPAIPSSPNSPTPRPSRFRSRRRSQKLDLGVLRDLSSKKIMLGVLDLGNPEIESARCGGRRGIRNGPEARRRGSPCRRARLRHEIHAAPYSVRKLKAMCDAAATPLAARRSAKRLALQPMPRRAHTKPRLRGPSGRACRASPCSRCGSADKRGAGSPVGTARAAPCRAPAPRRA